MAVHPDNDSIYFSDDTSDDGFHYVANNENSPFRLTRYSRSLIDFVRNEWQNSAKYSSSPYNSPSTRPSARHGIHVAVSLISAPRFRRYVFVYLILLLSLIAGWKWVLSPQLAEHTSLLVSLGPQSKLAAGGWYGTNALPELENIVRIRSLNPNLLPRPMENPESRRRLIFIGDVHGCKDELTELLEKTTFNPSNDHLIFTGDLITRGPDSLGVVDLARKHSASCVRGNNDDQVLILRHSMPGSKDLDEISKSPDTKTNSKTNKPLSKTSQARNLARQLTDEQAEWLDTCPVILKVGQIPKMGEVVVVHAGLVPGVEFEKQDPVSVMNMHSIDLETHVPSASRKGVKWTKLFNKDQSLLYSRIKNTVADPLSKMTTVIYGHDSKSGLSIKSYTKGLDSGCVNGGKLTALVISDGGKQEYVQVRCRDYQGSNLR
ncbi:ser Thr protein phosphatase [Aspergillus sclerotialis]|uniref:Ser Thr protein phosphatase n=1 Tax=Aspergillus sclerotialis TaxID=2070753 RepID=A0A3A3A4S5_9EURO|nr:ser Thr protein phosphatase [Aspergillus sclerotialis]